MTEKKAQAKSSYGQIFRSSSIIGGAQGFNYVIGLARVKIVAILLGTTGVGLVGLYMSALSSMSTISGLGMMSSGIRELADARGSNDELRFARSSKVIVRLFFVTGLLGWLFTVLLSLPLSKWAFGSDERWWAIAVLGVIVFLGNISGAQVTLLQGVRRIGDIARIAVMGSAGGAVVAVGIYSWLGEKGIVPVLITTAVINVGFSTWFARKIRIEPVTVTWVETVACSKRLINLGVAFMYGGLLVALIGLVIRGEITQALGLEAAGMFQAAWNISVLFASFVIGAMAVDFFPRLTEVASDNEKVNSLVNEQMEIGMLLTLPGVVIALSFGQWIIRLLYTKEFLPSADLIPWLMCGVFGQIASMPMGFIQKVKMKVGWIYFSQSHLNVLHIVLALIFLSTHGIIGVSWAFAIATYAHCFVTYLIARKLSGFRCSADCARLLMLSNALVFAGIVAQATTEGLVSLLIGFTISGAATLFALRGLSSRLGENHKVIQLVIKFPGGRHLCGLA